MSSCKSKRRGCRFRLAAALRQSRYLEAIVSKCLVRICRLVLLFALSDCGACIVGGVGDLGCEPVDHSLSAAAASCCHEPAKGERHLAVRTDFHRNLVCCATDAPRLDFYLRHNVAY